MFLSSDQLRELTGRARRAGQRQWLADNGLPFRADGARVLVARYHVLDWLAGRAIAPSRGVDLSGVR
jgi:hypothetical protein